MITQTVWKHFSCATDVRAIGKSAPREVLFVIGAHRKYLMKAPE